MDARYSAYLAYFLGSALKSHAQQWGDALKYAFDVAVCCESQDLAELVMSLVETQRLLDIRSSNYRVILLDSSSHEPKDTNDVRLPARTPNQTDTVGVRLYLCVGTVPAGLIAVRFNLPTLQSLLPSVATIVVGLLEHLTLDRYIDCFDATTLAKLKRIYEVQGVVCLFDAIVQVAYLAGVLGDDSQSYRYLDSLAHANERAVTASHATPNSRFQLEQLLDRFMASHDPYDTLKATLAHYAFFGKKVSQAEASRTLKVSRSTLQSHLNLAERLNVARLFSDGPH